MHHCLKSLPHIGHSNLRPYFSYVVPSALHLLLRLPPGLGGICANGIGHGPKRDDVRSTARVSAQTTVADKALYGPKVFGVVVRR